MVALDELLSVIENPTRRKILEALVREPHYPLQLSKELGMSQQAIMKHLKVLEGYHLVRSFQEESDLGGPMRKKYCPALNFTIVVDLGPNLFNAELLTREHIVRAVTARGEGLAGDELDPQVKQLRENMAEIDRQLLELQQRRDQLIEEKERTMDDVARLIARLPDYQVRKVMYEFISRPDLDPEGIARELSIRDEVVLRYLKVWLER
jgi:ArsR family transcriptional regulator